MMPFCNSPERSIGKARTGDVSSVTDDSGWVWGLDSTKLYYSGLVSCTEYGGYIG